jgi:quinol monooxygenase YgiN
MTVLVQMRMDGDTEIFAKSLTERADEYRAIAEQAKAAGAVHHRFGIGDGYVLVSDEWVTEQAFHDFLTRPDLQQFISEVGGDVTQPPDVLITEAIESPDQF